MAFRLPFRRQRQGDQPVLMEAPPLPQKPPVTSRLLAPLLSVWRGVQAAFSALDHAFSWFAVPFGTRVRDPRVRYPLLLGIYALIYLLGALPIPYLPLVALGFGYIGVLAIGRAWV